MSSASSLHDIFHRIEPLAQLIFDHLIAYSDAPVNDSVVILDVLLRNVSTLSRKFRVNLDLQTYFSDLDYTSSMSIRRRMRSLAVPFLQGMLTIRAENWKAQQPSPASFSTKFGSTLASSRDDICYNDNWLSDYLVEGEYSVVGAAKPMPLSFLVPRGLVLVDLLNYFEHKSGYRIYSFDRALDELRYLLPEPLLERIVYEHQSLMRAQNDNMNYLALTHLYNQIVEIIVEHRNFLGKVDSGQVNLSSGYRGRKLHDLRLSSFVAYLLEPLEALSSSQDSNLLATNRFHEFMGFVLDKVKHSVYTASLDTRLERWQRLRQLGAQSATASSIATQLQEGPKHWPVKYPIRYIRPGVLSPELAEVFELVHNDFSFVTHVARERELLEYKKQWKAALHDLLRSKDAEEPDASLAELPHIRKTYKPSLSEAAEHLFSRLSAELSREAFPSSYSTANGLSFPANYFNSYLYFIEAYISNLELELSERKAAALLEKCTAQIRSALESSSANGIKFEDALEQLFQGNTNKFIERWYTLLKDCSKALGLVVSDVPQTGVPSSPVLDVDDAMTFLVRDHYKSTSPLAKDLFESNDIPYGDDRHRQALEGVEWNEYALSQPAFSRLSYLDSSLFQETSEYISLLLNAIVRSVLVPILLLLRTYPATELGYETFSRLCRASTKAHEQYMVLIQQWDTLHYAHTSSTCSHVYSYGVYNAMDSAVLRMEGNEVMHIDPASLYSLLSSFPGKDIEWDNSHPFFRAITDTTSWCSKLLEMEQAIAHGETDNGSSLYSLLGMFRDEIGHSITSSDTPDSIATIAHQLRASIFDRITSIDASDSCQKLCAVRFVVFMLASLNYAEFGRDQALINDIIESISQYIRTDLVSLVDSVAIIRKKYAALAVLENMVLRPWQDDTSSSHINLALLPSSLLDKDAQFISFDQITLDAQSAAKEEFFRRITLQTVRCAMEPRTSQESDAAYGISDLARYVHLDSSFGNAKSFAEFVVETSSAAEGTSSTQDLLSEDEHRAIQEIKSLYTKYKELVEYQMKQAKEEASKESNAVREDLYGSVRAFFAQSFSAEGEHALRPYYLDLLLQLPSNTTEEKPKNIKHVLLDQFKQLAEASQNIHLGLEQKLLELTSGESLQPLLEYEDTRRLTPQELIERIQTVTPLSIVPSEDAKFIHGKGIPEALVSGLRFLLFETFHSSALRAYQWTSHLLKYMQYYLSKRSTINRLTEYVEDSTYGACEAVCRELAQSFASYRSAISKYLFAICATCSDVLLWYIEDGTDEDYTETEADVGRAVSLYLVRISRLLRRSAQVDRVVSSIGYTVSKDLCVRILDEAIMTLIEGVIASHPCVYFALGRRALTKSIDKSALLCRILCKLDYGTYATLLSYIKDLTGSRRIYIEQVSLVLEHYPVAEVLKRFVSQYPIASNTKSDLEPFVVPYLHPIMDLQTLGQLFHDETISSAMASDTFVYLQFGSLVDVMLRALLESISEGENREERRLASFAYAHGDMLRRRLELEQSTVEIEQQLYLMAKDWHTRETNMSDSIGMKQSSLLCYSRT